MPKNICTFCIQQIRTSFLFKTQMDENFETLEKMFVNHRSRRPSEETNCSQIENNNEDFDLDESVAPLKEEINDFHEFLAELSGDRLVKFIFVDVLILQTYLNLQYFLVIF